MLDDMRIDAQEKNALGFDKERIGFLKSYAIYKASAFDEEYMSCLNDRARRATEDFLEMASAYKTRDPDGYSVKIQDVYRALWTALDDALICDKEDYAKSSDGQPHIASDTMCSAQTIINAAMRFPAADIKYNYAYCWAGILKSKESISFSKNSMIALVANEDTTHISEYMEKKYPHLISFLKVSHSIGNYIPLPSTCNCARGFGVLKDFWDLTLACVYNYFPENREKIMYRNHVP